MWWTVTKRIRFGCASRELPTADSIEKEKRERERRINREVRDKEKENYRTKEINTILIAIQSLRTIYMYIMGTEHRINIKNTNGKWKRVGKY